MVEHEVNNFFEDYLETEGIFKNKKSLSEGYIPNNIEHRDEQLQETASILAPALKEDQPSNLFIYGKTGTGKTLVAQYIAQSMRDVAKEEDIPLKIIYTNCKLKKVADTEYRLVAQLAREFGKAIPPTGLPTDEVYSIFYDVLDSKQQTVILLLDEIDQLAKRTGDDVLYNLTRINSELDKATLSIVGISNDVAFIDQLDARVRSSLSEEEIVFPPYNALQIQDILQKRSKEAFRENSISDGVIEKCAAFAARDHGDARRAIELLRVAGELAERDSSKKIKLDHLDQAEEKIEKDRVLDIILNQPKQFKVVLYSIIKLKQKDTPTVTGEVYEVYEKICRNISVRPLTQRRVSDIIAELDMLGIINAQVVSKGRYGRTRDISLAMPESMMPKIKEMLTESLDI